MRVLAGALALLAVSTITNAAEPVVAISPEAQKGLARERRPEARGQQETRVGHVAQLLAGRPTSTMPTSIWHPSTTSTTRMRRPVSQASRLISERRIAHRWRSKDHIDRLVSIVAERDLVVLALVREGKDKDGNAYTTTWFDMFRVANGKIVEHWDTATKP